MKSLFFAILALCFGSCAVQTNYPSMTRLGDNGPRDSRGYAPACVNGRCSPQFVGGPTTHNNSNRVSFTLIEAHHDMGGFGGMGRGAYQQRCRQPRGPGGYSGQGEYGSRQRIQMVICGRCQVHYRHGEMHNCGGGYRSQSYGGGGYGNQGPYGGGNYNRPDPSLMQSYRGDGTDSPEVIQAVHAYGTMGYPRGGR